MSEANIRAILLKICQLGRNCKLLVLDPSTKIDEQFDFRSYLSVLQYLQVYMMRMSTLQEQYSQLEQFLQRQQTQLRKHIGVQQQLRLTNDALRTQVEELEKEKLELLQNAKLHIKQLKKVNEELFIKIQKESDSPSKSKGKGRSVSNRKNRDRSIRQIVKTEYLEREHSNSENRHKSNQKKFGLFSSITQQKNDQREISNSGTGFSPNKKLKIPMGGKKKLNKNIFSNGALLQCLSASKKKGKNQIPTCKSPQRQKQNKPNKSRIPTGKTKQRQKKTNKSVFSVSFLDCNVPSKLV